MRKTLLAIGDDRDVLLRKYFRKNTDILEGKGIKYRVLNYQQILDKPESINDTGSENVIVLFFFPYNYWDNEIESKLGIYGNKKMGEYFEEFFNRIGSIIISRHRCKVTYVNNPFSIALVRDKKRSHNVLEVSNVSCPKVYENKTIDDVLELTEQGNELILKVRCGSLGKGITYLTKQKWFTNFKYINGEPLNHSDDKGWEMREIPKEKGFLERLLENDVLVEEAIKTPIINDKKFDLRVFVIYQDPMFMYVKTTDVGKVVTNWYQGGTIEPLSFLDNLPKESIELAKEEAVKAANAYGLNNTGIDVIFSSGYEKAFILEGNAFPGIPTPEIPPSVFDPMRCLFEKI